MSRRAKRRIHQLPTAQPIFEAVNIQKQIDEAFSRQVWLPCGGYIVIDETEALISIRPMEEICRTWVFALSFLRRSFIAL